MLLNVPTPENTDVWAVVCRGRTCLPPITEPEELVKVLAENSVRERRFESESGI
jgi:uncharacterized protein YyaL (SSP411 family)